MIFASLKWLKTIVLNVLCFVLHLLLHFFCFVLGFLWTFSNLSPKFLWSQNRRCTCRVFERSKPLTFLFLINPPLSTMQCQWHFCPRPAAVFVLSLPTCWKTNRSTQVGTGKAWKGKTRGHQPFPKTILHSVYSWVVPALQITLELLKLDQFSFSIKRGLKFLLEALQGLTSITRKNSTFIQLECNALVQKIIQTWLPGTSEGSYENTSWRLHTLFHIILYVGFKLASLSTATAWRSFKASKKSKASRFVSSLACCLSAWKSLPGSEMSDPLQSGAKILHFRPPSRVQSAAQAPEMHTVTHWKNRTVYFQLWQLLQVQRKNSSAKKKNAISSPLACHLDPFVKL